MWENILVLTILAVAGGITLWRFYQKFTGKSSCCGGGCSCKGGCGGGGEKTSCGESPAGLLVPMKGGGCGCTR